MLTICTNGINCIMQTDMFFLLLEVFTNAKNSNSGTIDIRF